MNKKLLIVLFLIFLVGIFFVFKKDGKKEETIPIVSDYKNTEYMINGQKIKLVNGISEIESAPGSASKTITKYFGNEVKKDLNADGREDVVFLLTQETGGSGTFFYAVASLNTEAGFVGSQGLLLGDRIAPQTTESGQGNIVIVNYAERKPGEPFTVAPSVGKSIQLLLDVNTMQFGEVVKDFEGEANPDQMTLFMKTWNWVSALYNDGTEIKPKKLDKFTITFGKDGKFSATTDCNRMSGSYTVKDKVISFGSIAMTKMFCEGSQESTFASLLETASGYHFTSKGELILDLKFDSGSAVFR